MAEYAVSSLSRSMDKGEWELAESGLHIHLFHQDLSVQQLLDFANDI